MQVAILHYHLHPGGVTQVIGHHLRAMRLVADRLGVEAAAVLYDGERSPAAERLVDERSTGPGVRLVPVPGLAYDAGTACDPEGLAAELQSALDGCGFASERTLLHIHNHSLGKNSSLPGAVRQLAAAGYRQLLQIHDFAEDLRPANYRHLADSWQLSDTNDVSRGLYPCAAQIHYAVLNHRDYGVLQSAGVAAGRLHLLPNPVGSPDRIEDPASARLAFEGEFDCRDSAGVVVYPVRGIRRKNLGEFLLTSALTKPGTISAVTLPATSAAEVPSYDAWRGVAARLQLPVRWEVGLSDRLSFPEIIAASDRILTTSIAEGFGMVFLEAWLYGRMLVGRNLPEITSDFVDRGVDLQHLASSIEIPTSWIGADAFAASLRESFGELAARYGCDPESFDQETLDRLASSESVDFARLTPQHQADVIERVWTDPASREAIRAGNSALWNSLACNAADFQPLIDRNADAVREHWSLEASSKRLEGVYRSVMSSGCSETVGVVESPERVLEQFLSIDRLYPLRVAP